MNLLVGINNNTEEWNNTLHKNSNRPRLPLPYNLGGAFFQRGHCLSAINFAKSDQVVKPLLPFEHIYHRQELLQAMNKADAALLWAAEGSSAIVRQSLLRSPRRRVLLASYVWQISTLPGWKNRLLGIATQTTAQFAKGLVVMTSEQQEAARQVLWDKVPIIHFTCGIDTSFYASPSNFATDVPENYHNIVTQLLEHPYVIMSGDEQRCNQDAIDIVARSNLRLVRVSQYKPQVADWFRSQIREQGIEDRCFFFQRISYPFLRFLFHHAAAYAGLVDSTWQPAGWTVACEALASGLPVILYEGLVSRELQKLGAGDLIHTIPIRNKEAFKSELQTLKSDIQSKQNAREFAAKHLDCEITGNSLANEVEALLSSK